MEKSRRKSVVLNKLTNVPLNADADGRVAGAFTHGHFAQYWISEMMK